MIAVRKAEHRGNANHGWLDTRYTFSFSDYYDPRFMGFRALRVMNEDRIEPGHGFGMHPHRDMEIVTYVLEGQVAHRDSLGTSGTIERGELQRITAGTGILHSEHNASNKDPLHLYQIWLLPERPGLAPGYEQRQIDLGQAHGAWRLVASPTGADGSLTIHQDVRILVSTLEDGRSLTHEVPPGRHAWLQVLRGGVDLRDQRLSAGDGAAISGENDVSVTSRGDAELMLFDLA
jgi:redox-sensitive bicupin YhaK (pirin superfamily)